MAESKVKSENFIVVQGWMLKDLGLKGNELLIYACIYGFSQADDQKFTGSLQYLADWTNSTKRSVLNNLQSLQDKGYIGKVERYINGVKFCEYHVTNFTGVVKNFQGGMEKSSLGGSEESSPNNIAIDNIDKNIVKNIRHKYGEYNNVLLTDEELEKLKAEYSDYQQKIENLSSYIASSGKKYKSHYATIRNWARKDKDNKQKPVNKTAQQLDDFYDMAAAWAEGE